MSSRNAQPDILAEVLGGALDAEPLTIALLPPRRPAAKPRRAPAQPQPATQQPDAPVRVAWEYLEVVYRDYRGWRARVVNGAELGDWKQSPTIVEHLKQLGDNGWELVSIGDRHDNHKEAYFKRPVAR